MTNLKEFVARVGTPAHLSDVLHLTPKTEMAQALAQYDKLAGELVRALQYAQPVAKAIRVPAVDKLIADGITTAQAFGYGHE